MAQRIQEIGPVRKANCSRSISELLGELPQFSDLPVTWFPEKTMENLARLMASEPMKSGMMMTKGDPFTL